MIIAKVAVASPLTILVDGATVAITAVALAHYSPVANDRVVVDRVGSSIVIVGKLP